MTPADLPALQDLPCAWYGPQMSASPDGWTLALSQADCREMRAALDAWLARQAGLADDVDRAGPGDRAMETLSGLGSSPCSRRLAAESWRVQAHQSRLSSMAGR
jgi:hypothetical protein